jgi:hypothetical protein
MRLLGIQEDDTLVSYATRPFRAIEEGMARIEPPWYIDGQLVNQMGVSKRPYLRPTVKPGAPGSAGPHMPGETPAMQKWNADTNAVLGDLLEESGRVVPDSLVGDKYKPPGGWVDGETFGGRIEKEAALPQPVMDRIRSSVMSRPEVEPYPHQVQEPAWVPSQAGVAARLPHASYPFRDDMRRAESFSDKRTGTSGIENDAIFWREASEASSDALRQPGARRLLAQEPFDPVTTPLDADGLRNAPRGISPPDLAAYEALKLKLGIK